jgi:hypothetical protein
MCTAAEATELHLKAISGSKDSEEVHKLTQRKGFRRDPKPKVEKHQKANIRECRFCGGHHEMKKEKCPAWVKPASSVKEKTIPQRNAKLAGKE